MTNKTDKLIYHLLWMLDQYCDTNKEEIYQTRYNACGHAADTLFKLGYIELLKGNWPETHFIQFALTDKGKLAKYRNDLWS
jgi:hypothetical protein